jgi:trk system potassium uptake protein TrkH
VAKQARELRYAVRSRVFFKYFGQLCLVLAVLTMVPLMMSLIFGETSFTLRYAVVVCGLLPVCRPMRAWCWWPLCSSSRRS